MKRRTRRLIVWLSFFITFLFCFIVVIEAGTQTDMTVPYYLVVLRQIEHFIKLPWWWLLGPIASVFGHKSSIGIAAILLGLLWGALVSVSLSWLFKYKIFSSRKGR